MASRSSYTAKGHVEPPHLDQELGSSLQIPVRDLVPELGSRFSALRTFDKMARTDVTCGVALRAAKVPIQGSEFYVDPVGEDQINQDAAAFVEYNLFNGMSSPWSYVLTRILKMYQHGFAILEPVWTQGEWSPTRKMANAKRYTMLRKLAYRPALSISQINYDDNGGPASVEHNALRKDGKSEKIEIPIEKAIIFPFGDADDLYGESILRASYANWYYKTHLYKVDAIQKERHSLGIPQGTLPPGYKESDEQAMNELLANIRANEKSYMTLPPGYEVGFAKIEGQLPDVLKSAGHHDVLILLNVFAQFLMLGVGEQSGSRAVSGAQLDIFYKSEWFVAQSICDYLNQFLIPNLVLYNFEIDTIPQLKVRNIGQSRDLQQLASALANVVSNEIITNDLPTENWARALFDMPAKQGDRPAKPAPTRVEERIVDQAAPASTNGKKTDIAGVSGGGNQPKGTNPPTP